MSEQRYYKAKKTRMVDVTQLRKETIQLINQNCRLIGRYSGLSGVFAELILPECMMMAVKHYLFKINYDEVAIKTTISNEIEHILFEKHSEYCYQLREGLGKNFAMQLTLLLWKIIDSNRLPLLDERRRLTLVNTDLDYEDLEIEIKEFVPKSKVLTGKHYFALFTISGIYEGRLISESQLTARTAARWVVKQAIMIYGPKKYIALAKKTFGVYKLFKKLVSYVTEERINPHVPNDKESLLKSETIQHLGENLEEYVESKVITYAKNELLDKAGDFIK